MNSARILALVLALGACVWGFALYPLLFHARGLLFLGPGYVLAAAYVYRVFATPSAMVRQLIWGPSLLFHGVWMGYVLFVAWWDGRVGAPAVLVWHAFAALTSGVGLAIDNEKSHGDVRKVIEDLDDR